MGFFRNWMEQGNAPQPSTMRPDPLANVMQSPFWQQVLDSQDGLSRMIEMKQWPGNSHRLILGAQVDDLAQTAPDTSVLILGPPRSVGKTAGLMIPIVLTARGPVVAVSTKPDLYVASALHRRRSGRILCYAPDGSPPLPGSEEVRWSPISDDWGVCLARSTWMAQASNMSKGSESSGKFWESRAATLLAVTLFYAGISGKDMEWVVEVISNYDLAGDFKPIHTDLIARGHAMPAKLLSGIVKGSDRTRADIFASCGVILSPYFLPGSLRTTKGANFDAEAFVKGQPDERNHLIRDSPMNGDTLHMANGRQWTEQLPWDNWIRQFGVYDTVYISCSEENMSLTAPLIIGFLGDIRRQVLKQHREDELAALTERRPPVLWVLDELAACPIPDLSKILADAGSQNLIVCAALQTLGQTSRWGEEGKSLQTLFNNVLVLPGCREKDVNDLWSTLVGDFDQEVWQGSWSGTGKDKEWNASQSWQRRRRLEPSDIYSGNPNDRDAALVFHSHTWQWATLQIYFRTGLWPVMLKASATFACRVPEIVNQGLPYPDLARRGDYSHLAAIHPELAKEFYREQLMYSQHQQAMTTWRQRAIGGPL